jgi:ATP-dependent DNA ligase
MLMANGHNLTQHTLKQRRELLAKSTKNEAHVFELSEWQIASSLQDVITALDVAIEAKYVN